MKENSRSTARLSIYCRTCASMGQRRPSRSGTCSRTHPASVKRRRCSASVTWPIPIAHAPSLPATSLSCIPKASSSRQVQVRSGRTQTTATLCSARSSCDARGRRSRKCWNGEFSRRSACMTQTSPGSSTKIFRRAITVRPAKTRDFSSNAPASPCPTSLRWMATTSAASSPRTSTKAWSPPAVCNRRCPIWRDTPRHCFVEALASCGRRRSPR